MLPARTFARTAELAFLGARLLAVAAEVRCRRAVTAAETALTGTAIGIDFAFELGNARRVPDAVAELHFRVALAVAPGTSHAGAATYREFA